MTPLETNIKQRIGRLRYIADNAMHQFQIICEIQKGLNPLCADIKNTSEVNDLVNEYMTLLDDNLENMVDECDNWNDNITLDMNELQERLIELAEEEKNEEDETIELEPELAALAEDILALDENDRIRVVRALVESLNE